jgi:ABC-type transport system involved in multi-copper enzyme maturation permease subunit
MKKQIIIGAGVMILFVFAFIFILQFLFNGIDKEKDKYKSKIGVTYVLDGDTTTVVDYSTIMETFTLSNGKKINSSLLFNKK